MKTWKMIFLKALGFGGDNHSLQKDSRQKNSSPFEPAPSYWALIPVRVEAFKRNNPGGN